MSHFIDNFDKKFKCERQFWLLFQIKSANAAKKELFACHASFKIYILFTFSRQKRQLFRLFLLSVGKKLRKAKLNPIKKCKPLNRFIVQKKQA